MTKPGCAEIEACRTCRRLVAWREVAAANPPARFRGETNWARDCGCPAWKAGEPAPAGTVRGGDLSLACKT